jgi:hypothetical protein
MVHALEKVRTLLNPDGCILAIHDLVDPPRISVQSTQYQYYAGQLFSDNNFENQRMADQAIDLVVQEGSFTASQFNIFENLIHIESFTSLQEWLDDTWESAYLTDQTQNKIIELADQLGAQAEVVVHMISRIIRLDPS